MESEANFENQSEQLVAGMMSFLDDSDEDRQLDEFDEEKNPLCWAIKRIINVFPPRSSELEDDIREPLGTFYSNRTQTNQIEKDCRCKDPYMQEVNRLMFSSSVGHPPTGSPEYYQSAENYALFGKEFLDFPTHMRYPQSLDVNSFGDIPNIPSCSTKMQHFPGFGGQIGKSSKQLSSTNAPQQQIFVNQTNYCSYPFIQSQNFIQPLIYSNPFLMTQYLNAFVKESQINASLVQQQQFLGGFHERLLYAQMLQQQIQTNQAALMSSCFISSAAGAKCKSDLVKMGNSHSSETAMVSLKPDLDDGVVCENPIVE